MPPETTCSPRCPNCVSAHVEVLDRAGATVGASEEAPARPLVTSDAQRLDDVRVTRLLCLDCACVGLVYDPPDRLRRFFAGQYDLDDTVQNHPVVVGGHLMLKHDRVASALSNALRRLAGADLPESGRWLEIACGRGDLTLRFQSAHPGWRCHALDPSADSGDALLRADSRIRFTRDFFDPDLFGERRFDLIAAHGFLNRSPLWPELKRIRRLCRPGTLLSLDLLVLENSVFAPHIWDHPFMFSRAVLQCTLATAGFTLRGVTDCVSSLHVLAEYRGVAGERPPRPGEVLVARTRRLMHEHAGWWRDVVSACRAGPVRGGRMALYGAGLYNAVLLSLVEPSRFAAVIDETKAGGTFFGLDVISPEEAARRGLRVLICARPEYVARMVARARGVGLSAVVPGRIAGLDQAGGPACDR